MIPARREYRALDYIYPRLNWLWPCQSWVFFIFSTVSNGIGIATVSILQTKRSNGDEMFPAPRPGNCNWSNLFVYRRHAELACPTFLGLGHTHIRYNISEGNEEKSDSLNNKTKKRKNKQDWRIILFCVATFRDWLTHGRRAALALSQWATFLCILCRPQTDAMKILVGRCYLDVDFFAISFH